MTKIYLPIYGDLYFEKEGTTEIIYKTVIEMYQLDEVTVGLSIISDKLDEEVIDKIETIFGRLKGMNNAAKQAYLDDFNDEEENVYTNNIYKDFLGEAEFESLKHRTTTEQRLLYSVNLTSIDIDLRKENTPVTFNYIKGYELTLLYKFNHDGKLKEMIFKPGVFIIKEQLASFIDKWGEPEVKEICSRFRKDWQNYPVKSYFIYLMAKRIRSFL